MEFFIVFHKSLYKDNYNSFSEIEKQRLLRFVAVNEAIPKNIPDWLPNNSLIEEYHLPIYHPLYQLNKYYQNSFLFALVDNLNVIKTKYIGFGQYDQYLPAKLFLEIEQRILVSETPTIYGAYPHSFETIYNLWDTKEWNTIIDIYNKLEKTNIQYDDLKKLPLFLCHTFVLPSQIFIEIMIFVKKIESIVLQMLKYDVRHMAGTLERVIAIIISCKIIQYKLCVCQINGIEHKIEQREPDNYRDI
jgi:hypothetical protein